MKITKGKWTIDFGSGSTVVYLKAGKTIMATINTLEDGIDNVTRRAEAKANARLIAAAPDLLAACRRIKKRCDTGGLIDKDTTGLYNCVKFAILAAEA